MSYTTIATFLTALFPHRKTGKLRIMLSKGDRPNYLFFAEDKQILDDLSEALNKHFRLRLQVWNQKNPSELKNIDLIGHNKFHMYMTTAQAEKISKKTHFIPEEAKLELQLKKAVLDEKGYQKDNANQLEIDFAQSLPEEVQFICQKIESFAIQLEREYRQKKAWLRFFCPDTKHYKAEQLCRLAENIKKTYNNNPNPPPTKLEDWKFLIDEALQDKKLTQSILSNRTKTLLTNIQRNTFSR